jgi:hypothetical protein
VQELVDAGYLRRGADQGDRRSEKVARTLKDPILRTLSVLRDEAGIDCLSGTTKALVFQGFRE